MTIRKFILSAVAAASSAAAAAPGGATFAELSLIGTNVPPPIGYAPTLVFRNMAFNSSGFMNYETFDDYTGTFSNGWPNQASCIKLWEGASDRPSGVYQSRVVLPGTTSSTVFSEVVSLVNQHIANCTIQNATWVGSETWNFELNYTGDNRVVALKFTQAWRDLKVMLPEYTRFEGRTFGPYSPDDTALFCEEFLHLHKRFSVLRFMDWAAVNQGDYSTNNPCKYSTTKNIGGTGVGSTSVGIAGPAFAPGTTWTWRLSGSTPTFRTGQPSTYTTTAEDVALPGWSGVVEGWPEQAVTVSASTYLATPSAWLQTRSGIPHEYIAQFAAELKALTGNNLKAVWVCMHTWADDAWHTTVADIYASTVPSGVKVLLELGNEIWNWTLSNQPSWAGSYPDSTDYSLEWRDPSRGQAQRHKEIVPIWRAAFGESGNISMSNRLIPVLGAQQAGSGGQLAAIVASGMNVATSLYAIAPAYYSGDSNYVMPSRPSDGATTSAIATAADALANYQQSLVPLLRPAAIANKLGAMRLGLKVFAYEGGPHTLSGVPGATTDGAWNLSGMRDHIKAAYLEFYNSGFEYTMCHYKATQAGAQLSQTFGAYGPNYADTPISLGIADTLATVVPAQTGGAYEHSGAVDDTEWMGARFVNRSGHVGMGWPGANPAQFYGNWSASNPGAPDPLSLFNGTTAEQNLYYSIGIKEAGTYRFDVYATDWNASEAVLVDCVIDRETVASAMALPGNGDGTDPAAPVISVSRSLAAGLHYIEVKKPPTATVGSWGIPKIGVTRTA